MRLLPTDAEFVDVIHTNSGEIWNGALSLPEPVGQVDFYPNGGSHQAGCTEVCIGTSCIGIDLVDLFGEYYLLTNSLFNCAVSEGVRSLPTMTALSLIKLGLGKSTPRI